MSARLVRQTTEDGRANINLATTWLLAKMAGDITLAGVQALYTSGDEDTRWCILTAQQHLRVPGLETQLRQIAQGNETKAIRVAAFIALVAVKDQGAVAIAQNLVDHADPEIAHIARFAYEQITGEALKNRK